MTSNPLSIVPIGVVERAVFGALEVERTAGGIAPRRLPLWTRAQYATPTMEWVANQTTGMHLDFLTSAEEIELDVAITRNMSEGVLSSDRLSSFIAEVDGVETDRVALDEGRRMWVGDGGGYREKRGAPSCVALRLGGSAGVQRRLRLWLPHNSWVEIREVRASAPLLLAPSRGVTTWLHHGSSISHCTNAADPLQTWPSIAATALGVDVVNLGFNGQAMLDPFTARSIRDAAADVITLKVGINIVNGDTMRERAFLPALHGFLDTVREGHPSTPIVLISPIACPIHEDVPGPTVEVDGADAELYTGTPRPEGEEEALTLRRIRAIAEAVVSARAGSDSALFYQDGRELLGEDDADRLYDNLHPDGEGYRLMGTRFAAITATPGSPLGMAFALAGTAGR
jgi:hypothetical protein